MTDLKLGMPYMGSKRKLSKTIVDYIAAHNPNAKYFYDLFGGGGAVSFEALQRSQFKEVHYNELNTGVVELLKKIRNDGIDDEVCQWVDRETFNKHKNDNDWFGGLLKVVWSFSGNQKSYLFGKDIEQHHKNLFLQACKNIDTTKDMRDFFKVYIKEKLNTEQELRLNMPKSLDYKIRSLEIAGQLKDYAVKCGATNNKDMAVVTRCEAINRIHKLDRLSQLVRFNGLVTTNQSYESVSIDTPASETVIYCDPPYKGASQYAEKLDHKAFEAWVKNSPHKIYVSGYESDLKCVLELQHNSSFHARKNKAVIEKLFCNK